jgi:hypothetical protein
MGYLAAAIAAAAFVVSAAYVYAPVLRVHAARRLRFSPAAVAAASIEQLQPEALKLPDAVERLARAESEPWAADYIRQQAQRLYAESGDWNVVVGKLEQL